MKFKHAYNAKPDQGELNTQPSKTVPDMSMTVMEILQRSMRGQPVPQENIPVFHGEDIFVPDFKRLDLAEREELLEQARLNTQKLKEDLLKQQADKKARAVRQHQQKIKNESTDELEPIPGPRITNPPGDSPRPPEAKKQPKNG